MDIEGSVLMQKFELGKLLGKGTFAKVYHARNIKTGMSVAIKVIDKRKISKAGMMDQIKREISVMKIVRHPNVVQLYEVMGSKARIYIVMEYVRGGELFNKVAKGKLRECAARKYFQQLISGVDFCHSRGVYHRDLKPENLLLDENGNLKISDFGLSALAESKRVDGLLHTTCGTPAYVAPEIISKKGYDGAKSDIWSCGVILFVLLAGYLPFHGTNLMEMYRKIKEGEFLYPNWISSDVRELISKILDPEASNRISMSKIMRNSWFRKGVQLKNIGVKAMADGEAEVVKPAMLNAFDIISLSAGFDLSGLFDDKSGRKKEHKFTSNQSAKTIIWKLEEVAKRLKLKETKKGGGLVRFEKSKAGRKGPLSIDAEIFEIGPSFHVVEMKKCSGDTLEYERLMKRDIRPSLKDIVWTWQQPPENNPTLHSNN